MPYKSTLIAVAPDSTATAAVVPTQRGKKKTIHQIQYELLMEAPYTLSHRELVFSVWTTRQGLSAEAVAANRDQLWADLFQKEHPCMRASALTKKYGWGAYYNEDGKIGLVEVESAEYAALVADESVRKRPAMRSKRAKK